VEPVVGLVDDLLAGWDAELARSREKAK
jgi:hypothetical protein